MKLATINMLVSILGGIKLNKILDKRVKTTLVNDYLRLRKFVKEGEAERQDLVDKFQADWADELDDVETLRRAGKKVVGHDAYLDAEKDANKAISDIFAREVEVDIKPVPIDDFMASCGGEELTLEQLAFLQESGLVE
jgi:hypothetical protein